MSQIGTPAVALQDLALQRLFDRARTHPDKVYLTQPMGDGTTRDYTWAQVADETRRMAACLRSFGFPRGTRIGLLSKNCAWWLMSDYAIWLAGYVSVPLYPTLAPDTIAQILAHSEAAACFVGKLDGWEQMRPGIPEGLPCIAYPLSPPTPYPDWDTLIARHAPLQEDALPDAGDLCTIIYTSGTTGRPKGVMHSFGAFAWAVSAGESRIRFGPEDRVLSYLPLAHVAERMIVEFGSLANGVHVFFAESLDTFAQDLQRARPTGFFSVPRLWVKFQQGVHARLPPQRLRRLLRIPIVASLVRRKVLAGLGLDACRIAAGGAAPMPTELLQWYQRLGLNMIEVYGMTENCGVSHATLPGRLRPGTVGQPYDGVECRLDPDSGEVQMRSPGVMLGYFKDPELTAATITAYGWLRTGDKGELDAEGNLRITGRVKDLFKTSKGKYVAPAPIEDRLLEHPSIEAGVVMGANLERPLGVVMLSDDARRAVSEAAGRTALQAALAAHLESVNRRLDPHERLSCVVIAAETWTIENGVLTPTLKIRRDAIEARYGSRLEAWVRERMPVIWAEPAEPVRS
jgi:long-chain acyl-CoA synthetase